MFLLLLSSLTLFFKSIKVSFVQVLAGGLDIVKIATWPSVVSSILGLDCDITCSL